MINERRMQVETWMESGEEVLLNSFLPSIASSIYTDYENQTGIPGGLGSKSKYWLRSAKIGRTDGR